MNEGTGRIEHRWTARIGRAGRSIDLLAGWTDRARTLLADFLALRWARLGPIAYAVPVSMVIVVIHFWEQMPALLGPVPFWVAAAALVLAVVGGREAVARLRPELALPTRLMTALVGLVVVLWVLYDLLYLQTQRHLYDIDVYLGAAGRWMNGGQPYLTGHVSVWPSSAADDYFLYPPPLLPFFGALSRLPHDLVVAAWLPLLTAAGYAAYRLIGIRPLWSLLLLAFPPFFIGIESGNVASIAFLVFAAAGRAAGLLPLDGLFKVQSAIPALWLVRERRWRSLALGVAGVAAICLATLPVTGLGAWRDWLTGLTYRAESQSAVLGWYGMSFAHYLPAFVFGGIAVGLVVGALLLLPGRRGLAGLGVASIWASPALWPHGFLFALPALLFAESDVLVWLLLGAGAVSDNVWYLFYAAWLILLAAPGPRRAEGRGAVTLHPREGPEPWVERTAPTAAPVAATPATAVQPDRGPVPARRAD